jgi:hypothetical protein
VDADTVKNLGGWCQIAGVVLVIWDLLALTLYRVDVARAAARLRGWWAARLAAVRRVFGRTGRHQVVRAHAASGIGIAGHATVRSYPGPFTTRPGQSLEDQVAQLGHLVNRLRDDLEAERNERNRAISEERQARRAELQGEVERREAAVDQLRQAFMGLEEMTTEVRLRWEGVPFLVIGILFTTWPENFAHWLGWLPWRPLVLLVIFYYAARLSGVFSALHTT